MFVAYRLLGDIDLEIAESYERLPKNTNKITCFEFLAKFFNIISQLLERH